MLHLKRTILNTGVTLTVVAAGALAVEGVASAHDVAGHDGVTTHAVGKVTALGTDSFTITTHDGTTETIDTSPTTTFGESGTAVAPVGVTVGQDVIVSLDPSDATPTAVRVSILLDRVSGKVLDVTPASITLSGFKGAARDVVTSSGTEYVSGKTAATGVTVGQFVTAFGTPDATTPADLDALFVDIASTSPHPAHGPRVSPSHIVPNWATPQGGTPHTQVSPPVIPPVTTPTVPTVPTAPTTPSVTSIVPTVPAVTPTWSGSGARPSGQGGEGSHGFLGLGSQNGTSGNSGPGGELGGGFSGGGHGPGSQG
jgi:hypothetical protein